VVLLMLRASFLAVTVLMFSLGYANAGAPPESNANAALQYWQAFATLPKLTDGEAHKLWTEYLTMPLDGHAHDLVTKSDYALKMLHRGAGLSRCDWGINFAEDGIGVLLPHLQAARTLGYLACLRARIHFEQGRNKDAIEDLLAAMTLGRHVSLNGGFIAVLVGYQIERTTIETLAAYLPKLDAPTIKQLKIRLDGLPPFLSQSAAMLDCEKVTVEWFIRKVEKAKDEESLLAVLDFINIQEGVAAKDRNSVEHNARAFVAACGGTPAGIVKRAKEVLPSYSLIAEKLKLPIAEFEKAFERESARQAENPVFRVFFPAILKCRQSLARMEVYQALLAAAFAVQLDGRGALANHPNPVVGSPFEYIPIQGGYELGSKIAGKKVAITVGQGRK
jgi:hypothetical protein